MLPLLLQQLLLCCTAQHPTHVQCPFLYYRRLQAAEQLSLLQHQFNKLAQDVQRYAELSKQCSAATGTCIAYDGAANQKVRHAAVLELRLPAATP